MQILTSTLTDRRYVATVADASGREFTIITSIITTDDGTDLIGYHVRTADGRYPVNSDLRTFAARTEAGALWAAAAEAESLLVDWLAGADEEANRLMDELEFGPCAEPTSLDCTGLGTAYAGRCLPCDLELAAFDEMYERR